MLRLKREREVGNLDLVLFCAPRNTDQCPKTHFLVSILLFGKVFLLYSGLLQHKTTSTNSSTANPRFSMLEQSMFMKCLQTWHKP
ncbi:hypothetical protein SUGI_1147130 [Cryptomeria japonica]|nr:hypothetical protein SUGI_1147130 [Cryptomeria japonica]